MRHGRTARKITEVVTLPILVLAPSLALDGCGASSSSGAGAATPGPTSDGTASAGLPEGDYRTAPLSAADIRVAAHAAGFTDRDAASVTDLFTTSVTWRLVLSDGTWTEYESYDGAPAEIGWQGGYEVEDDHTVVALDPQCGDITYHYAIDSAGLHLDVVRDECPGRGELLHQTVIFESAPFVAQGAESTAAGSDAQTNATFVAPFTITVPEWVDPTPSESTEHFVTWESADQTRGIRVLSPIEVYRPGSDEAGPPPRHFAAYLTSLRRSGARISDVSHRDVDGRSAILMTLAAPAGNSLDGALGCPQAGLDAASCFGPQDELVLRVAFLEVNGHPVLLWEKDPGQGTGPVDYASFDAMLASLHFT